MSVASTGASPLNSSWSPVADSLPVEKPPLPDQAPLNSLLFSELKDVGQAEVQSSHKVRKMQIVSAEENGKIVYFKECDHSYPPSLAQIEAAGSASMRIVRGKGAARMRPVVNEKGAVVGAASYEIPYFCPLSKESLSAGVMARMGIMDELVARYNRMEDDLHGDQVGIAKDQGIVGLDYDELWYSEITAEIKGPRAINNGIFAPLPKDLFPVTDNDLDHFPVLTDAQPCHWPTKTPNNLALWKRFPNCDDFIKLASDSLAIEQKYHAFLRDILIDPADHLDVMTPNFAKNDEGGALLLKMRACIERRWEQLLEGCVQNRGFRDYVVNHKPAIVEILDYFRSYNRDYAENEMTIGLAKVEERFQNVVRKCISKDLAQALLDLAYRIKKSRRSKLRDFSPSYMSLVEVCQHLENSKERLPEAFFTFECGLRNLSLSQRSKMGEWNLLIKHVTQIVENYKGLVTDRIAVSEAPVKAGSLRRYSLTFPNEILNREKCLATALVDIVANPAKHQEIVGVVQKVLQVYTPTGHASALASVNPFSHTRTRTDEIEKLLGELKARPGERLQLISRFFDEGAWNSSGYLSTGSANVILIRYLVEKTLEDFKRRMTIERLLKYDLVSICFAIDLKEITIEDSARQIALLFQQIVKEKLATDPS